MDNHLIKSARRLVKLDAAVQSEDLQLTYKSFDVYPYIRNIVHSIQVQDIIEHEIELGKDLFHIYPGQRKITDRTHKDFLPDGFDNGLLVIGTAQQIYSQSYIETLRRDSKHDEKKIHFIDVEKFKFSKSVWRELPTASLKCFALLPHIYKLKKIIKQDFLLCLKATMKFVLHCKQINKKLNDLRDLNVDRVLLLVAHYGLEPLILEFKCRDMQVMELQHGVLFPEHFGYNLSLSARTRLLPIPDTFLFHYYHTMKNLHDIGKFQFMKLDTYKNIPLCSGELQNSDEKFDLILFSQPGLIKSSGQILSFVKETLNKLNIEFAGSFAVYSHPREKKDIDGLRYVNDEMTYRQALFSCKNAFTTSLSVVADATSLGLPILYTDYRNNIVESGLLEALGVKHEIYR